VTSPRYFPTVASPSGTTQIQAVLQDAELQNFFVTQIIIYTEVSSERHGGGGVSTEQDTTALQPDVFFKWNAHNGLTAPCKTTAKVTLVLLSHQQ